ncbi:hypothetical protein [Priestia aryabhattai]
MPVKNKTSIGLTQFIDFTVKGSSAKTTMVRKVKYQPDYHPAFDYWKPLRDQIIKFHSEDLSLGCFDKLINTVHDNKKQNYIHAVKQYKKFLKDKDLIWFNPGKSYWVSDELVVRSSPELGLIVDGEPHLIKLYFKGKSEKIDKRNISTALTLLNTSSYEHDHSMKLKYSVFNINKGRLLSDSNVNPDNLIALESEASQFIYIWNKI